MTAVGLVITTGLLMFGVRIQTTDMARMTMHMHSHVGFLLNR